MERLEALVRHMVDPIVVHKDAVEIRCVEGDAVRIFEMLVHPEDRDVIEGERGRTIRSMRTILSAAAGHYKATLDLVENFDSAGEE